MKNILLITILLAFSAGEMFSQSRALNKFYRQHKRENGVQNARIPGWLIRLGGKIAKKHVKEEEEKMALDLVKNLGATRFMYSEEGVHIPREDFSKLREDLMKSDFDDLIQVREGNMNFQLMIRDKGEVITDIFMLYYEDGEMVFLSAKAHIGYDQIAELVKKALEKEKKQIFEEPQPEVPLAEPTL